MNKKIVNFFLLVLPLLLLACSKPAYTDMVSKEIEKHFSSEQLSRYDRIVLIPNSGCTGCISQAEDYFAKMHSDERTLFIFTNIFSKKNLAIRIGKELLEQTNVWCDFDNSVYFSDYKECIYPCVIYLSEGTCGRFANMDELLDE